MYQKITHTKKERKVHLKSVTNSIYACNSYYLCSIHLVKKESITDIQASDKFLQGAWFIDVDETSIVYIVANLLYTQTLLQTFSSSFTHILGQVQFLELVSLELSYIILK